MGNSNSSSAQASSVVHPIRVGTPYSGNHLDWSSHSLEIPENSRNRMKKGYYPHKPHFIPLNSGGDGINPPLKVLPTSSSSKPLKPTSNGAILHKGGTISGKKLMAELESKKMLTNGLSSSNSALNKWNSSNNNNSKEGYISMENTPNLSRRGSSRSRDYESEPDMRREGSEPRHSSSPTFQPNSITVIKESPSKKQIIKSRKKYTAPPPPPSHSHQQHSGKNCEYFGENRHGGSGRSGGGGGGGGGRLFKTRSSQKEEAKLIEAERRILANLTENLNNNNIIKSSSNKIKIANSNNNSNVSSSGGSSLNNNKNNINNNNSSSNNNKNNNKKSKETSPPIATPSTNKTNLNSSSSSNSNSNKLGQGANLNLNSNANNNNNIKSTCSTSNKNNITDNGVSSNSASEKKTFYFGMDDTTVSSTLTKSKWKNESSTYEKEESFASSSNNNNNNSSSKNNIKQQLVKKNESSEEGRRQLSRSSNYSNNSSTNNNNKLKVSKNNQSEFANAKSDGHNNHNNNYKSDRGISLNNHKGKGGESKSNKVLSSPSNNEASLHNPYLIRKSSVEEDHHSGESNEFRAIHLSKSSKDNLTSSSSMGGANSRSNLKSESSTGKDFAFSSISPPSSEELSSSELDIPLLLRPTLPQKRRDLPRFSPTAAWRSLELELEEEEGHSPSPKIISRCPHSNVSVNAVGGGGGKRQGSYTSSEERIEQSVERPSLPPMHNHRGSGNDSGISAGDGGSPSNQHGLIPDVILPSSKENSGKNRLRITKEMLGKRGHGYGKGLGERSNCWTPEQDLDDSSSEYEPDLPPPSSSKNNNSGNMTGGQILLSSSHQQPKFTTRSNLFSSSKNNTSDSDSAGGKQQNQRRMLAGKQYAKGGMSGNGNGNLGGNALGLNGGGGGKSKRPIQAETNSSLKRQLLYRQHVSVANNQTMLDTNWVLSRSEPNSLNMLGLSSSSSNKAVLNGNNHNDFEEEVDGGGGGRNDIGCKSYNDDLLQKAFDTPFTSNTSRFQKEQEVRSEIGYGPSSMNFFRPSLSVMECSIDQKDNNEDENGWVSTGAQSGWGFKRSGSQSLILNGSGQNQERPPVFSHIMYLPPTDSSPRRISNFGAGGARRAKSVDNLDSAGGGGGGDRMIGSSNGDVQFGRRGRELRRNQPVNPIKNGRGGDIRILRNSSNHSQQQIIQNGNLSDSQDKKKKFKFQSTLRVMERRVLETQLAREAEEREMERLREIEHNRRVEEEFQRKRAKEKFELQKQKERDEEVRRKELNIKNKLIRQNASTPSEEMNGRGASSSNNNRHHYQQQQHHQQQQQQQLNQHSKMKKHRSYTNINGSNHDLSSTKSSSSTSNHNNNKNKSLRQEPEGAPASPSVASPTLDMRRDLIAASRKRSGNSSQSDLTTQEISEYKQHDSSRHYFDYRRSPSRLVASDFQSDLINSPLRGSRPRTPVEYGKNHNHHHNNHHHPSSNSSKVSIVSSQPIHFYHKKVMCDIPPANKPISYSVNNHTRLNGSNSNLVEEEQMRPDSGQSNFAPSVISDNYRKDWAHHNKIMVAGAIGPRTSSLASLHSEHNDSPRFSKRKSPLYHKYSNSPPSSPIPASSSADSAENDKESSTNMKNMISSGPRAYNAQPFKVKGYSPVAFKPRGSPAASVSSTPNGNASFHKIPPTTAVI